MLTGRLHRVAGQAAGVAFLAGAAIWLAEPILTHGCSERDERFAAVLADLPILAAHPAAATPLDVERGCDADDGFAHAGRRFRTELDRAAILSYYRSAAPAEGWQVDGEERTPVPSDGLVISGAAGCFHREIDGTTAYLKVWFPSDFSRPGPPDPQVPDDRFGIEVTGSHDGTAWC